MRVFEVLASSKPDHRPGPRCALCEVRQSYGFVRRFEVLTRFSLPGAR